MQQLTSLPSSFAAGTTVKYTRNYSDFPASDGWALTLAIRGAAVRDYTAAVVNGSHVFTLPATGGTGTDGLTPGDYVWEERASKAGEVYVPKGARGDVRILANTATAIAGELQSKAEKDLAVVDAKINGRLTADLEQYQIAGRAVTKIPIKELYQIRTKLRNEIRAFRSKGQFVTPVRSVMKRAC